VRRIEVVASELIVALPEQQVRVSLEGALERTPEGFGVHGSAMAPSLPLDLSVAANADLRVVRHDGDWSVLIHDSCIVVESGDDSRIGELRSEIVVAGAATEERVALRAEQSGAAGPVRIAGLHASLHDLRADIVAGHDAGRWTGRGRADIGLASIVHAPS
jgi:hypothetical protein